MRKREHTRNRKKQKTFPMARKYIRAAKTKSVEEEND